MARSVAGPAAVDVKTVWPGVVTFCSQPAGRETRYCRQRMDVTQSSSERPTGELLSAPAGDRCATCHSPLASDQRYCVDCGERRGKARFSSATRAAQAAPAPALAPAPSPRHRVSAGTTLVAGVATLLLALGLGFLMGHLTDKNTGQSVRAAAATPQVIKIDTGGGGGGTTASSGSSNGAGTTAAKQGSHAGLNQFKAPRVKVTQKVAQQATAAANKVLGSGAGNLAPATAQVGQSCSHGAGCQGGKFTGNFFGP